MKLRLLSLMVAAAVSAEAFAQAPAPTPAVAPVPAVAATPEARAAAEARRAELEKARADMQAAAKRYAELSRELGGEDRLRFAGREMDLRRPGVGIVMGSNGEAAGVRLVAVTPEGPAAKAGLRAGDVLESVDGKRIDGRGDAAIEQAREALKGLERGQVLRLGYRRDGKAAIAKVTADDIRRTMVFTQGGNELRAETFVFERGPTVAIPRIEGEIASIAVAPCAPGDDDCRAPLLTQALRWNGLNLASVDAKLGRYFGTDRGVLVVSADNLAGLEPGDVIQRIGGKDVASPRDAMRALREGEAGERVAMEVMRDRKRQTV